MSFDPIRTVATHLTQREFERFDRKVKKAGLTKKDALRAMILQWMDR